MFKLLKQGGFASIMEVIVSSIIFIIAAFGIFSSISMIRPHGAESSKKLEAAYIGREVIDDIRGQVDARTWDQPSSLLATGVNRAETIGDFNVTWRLEDVPGMNLRKLEMKVEYPD